MEKEEERKTPLVLLHKTFAFSRYSSTRAAPDAVGFLRRQTSQGILFPSISRARASTLLCMYIIATTFSRFAVRRDAPTSIKHDPDVRVCQIYRLISDDIYTSSLSREKREGRRALLAHVPGFSLCPITQFCVSIYIYIYIFAECTYIDMCIRRNTFVPPRALPVDFSRERSLYLSVYSQLHNSPNETYLYAPYIFLYFTKERKNDRVSLFRERFSRLVRIRNHGIYWKISSTFLLSPLQ